MNERVVTLIESIIADGRLFEAAIDSTTEALEMCGLKARCVGVSTVPSTEIGRLTGLIGVHGNVSGFCSVNASERVALKAVGGLLQDTFATVTAQVIDGLGEITNIVTGNIKSRISRTEWAFLQMTTPSVIVGHHYQLRFGHRSFYLSLAFELEDKDAVSVEDRMMRVTMSLMKP